MTEILKTKKVCRLKHHLQQVAKSLCAFSLFSFLFISCIDEGTNNTGDKSVPLSVGGVTLTLNKIRDISPLTSGSIGVFLSGTNYPTAKNNVQYTYSSGWSSSNPIYLDKNSASICAYSPYSTSITNSSAVALTSQLYSTNADLSYAIAQAKTSASPNIDFTMVRAYAMLTFHITHDASYTGSCGINNVSISSASSQINSGGSLNIGTGAYTYKAGAVNVPVSGVTITSGAAQDVAVLMVPVTSITSALTLSFTVDGSVLTGTLSAGTLTALATGSNYTINVTIKANSFTVSLASKGSGSSSMCAEPANCYMVAPGSSITIPVNIKGNGGDVAGTGLSTTFTPSSVGIVWQTSSTPLPITIGALNTTNYTVTVTAGSNSGNAVIAAYDNSATPIILWSWHIWVTDYNPNTPSNGTTYSYTNTSGVSNVWMDRNLGATSVATGDAKTLGLLYQWGRKDPFVNADTYNGTTSLSVTGTAITMTDGTSTRTLDFVIENPTIFVAITNSDIDWLYPSNDSIWGGARYGAKKTIFDPCPAGWRVPSWNKTSLNVSPWIGLEIYKASTYWSTNGYQWTTTPGIGFWPATGCRLNSSGLLYYVGSNGFYLSAKRNSGNNGQFLLFSNGSVSLTSSRTYLARGSSVRCVQE